MKRSRLVLAALAALILAAWWGGGRWFSGGGEDGGGGADPGGGNRAMDPHARGGAGPRGRGGAWRPPARPDGMVTISGMVVDAATHEGVGGVEVVFRGEAGEETTAAGPDGRFRIDVPAGAYRAFVRDETVLSVGEEDHVRLPGLPAADAAGAPDEALMPVVTASADVDGVELPVARGGVVRGTVVDRAGRPVAGAVLRAHAGRRPALGTDIAETGTDGAFELRLPAGRYFFEVTHARFAGIADADERQLELEPGEVQTATFTLVAGCVITGRVVAAGGGPAGEGAIERRWGDGDDEFSPDGRIAADGTFRWATTREGEFALRAWPWKSPPSPERTFACRDGARHDVVFSLPARGPDVDGVLVDRGGAPVALAYIDLASLDGGSGQQERTDEQGRWSVFQLAPGRYRVTAYAPGRGVVAATIEAPQTGVRLQLGGTGRIEGRTPLLAAGSFELTLDRCEDSERSLRLPAERRLVTVTDHRFSVEDVPACDLAFTATWRNSHARGGVEVPAGGVARVELDVGPPRAKVVTGTVTDTSGRPVEGVEVRAVHRDGEEAVATTDAAGRYTLSTFARAALVALATIDRLPHGAYGQVGMDDRDQETIDLTLRMLRTDGEDPPE